MLNFLKELCAAPCDCGREHRFDTEIYSGKGALANLSSAIAKRGLKKIYLICDANTAAVGKAQVLAEIEKAGAAAACFCFPQSPLPNEEGVGAALMNCPLDCDGVCVLGSGVLNDIGKMIAAHRCAPYFLVATAPSMDGFASATSSMAVGGLKKSLDSKAAEVVIGDAALLATAPKEMVLAGIGDMLAKYTALCEWHLSHKINGEYYCPRVAELIRVALQACVDHSDAALQGDEEAICCIFEGLVLGGIGMKLAGCSRPASGTEHYISHVLDMRNEAFGTPALSHGIQCGAATLIVVRLFERLLQETPDKAKAIANAKSFDYGDWSQTLRALVGEAADEMIALEKKEKKYDVDSHAKRLDSILNQWDALKAQIRSELPPYEELQALAMRIGLDQYELPIEDTLYPDVLRATKDIRDKYVLTRLLFDLGLLDEYVER